MEVKKTLYGLNDAPRSWYNKVKKEMLSLGAFKSKYDDALFIWHNHDGLYGLLGHLMSMISRLVVQMNS